MYHAGLVPYRLTEQHRMHPALAELPSELFYESSLTSYHTARSCTPTSVSFPWPDASRPHMFIHVPARDTRGAGGKSYVNAHESQVTCAVVRKLIENGVDSASIGVITPYKGQCLMLQLLFQNLHLSVEIATVDSFQGREKDYIVISCVRANENGVLGFLRD